MAGGYDNVRKLFVSDHYKMCKMCMRPLPIEYEKDCCPECEENMLFREVREFIRENDVTEYQLAERFNISIEHVKQWIKEGRIEYVQSSEEKIVGSRCQRCGVSVTFGTLCPSCLRIMNGDKKMKGVAVFKQNRDGNKMRYMGNKDGEN